MYLGVRPPCKVRCEQSRHRVRHMIKSFCFILSEIDSTGQLILRLLSIIQRKSQIASLFGIAMISDANLRRTGSVVPKHERS